jgi:DNA excision repair protein ERCC-3
MTAEFYREYLREDAEMTHRKKELLYVTNPNKFRTCEFLVKVRGRARAPVFVCMCSCVCSLCGCLRAWQFLSTSCVVRHAGRARLNPRRQGRLPPPRARRAVVVWM